MAFKELADLDCSVTTAIGGVNKETNKKNPTQIEGYYIGTRQVPSKKSKSGFCSLHVLQTQTGNVGVWGKTNLDQKMPAVKPGQMIRISFVGMVETQNNPMYKYKVQVDAANTIEVNLPEADASAGGEELGTSGEDLPVSFDEGDPEDTLEEDAPLDELPPSYGKAAPARKAAPPDARRAATVQNLLASRKAQ